jgi:predicted pyridoxine 5'-phosphate oxidase superfamily flavin-nucleotide-binding protein
MTGRYTELTFTPSVQAVQKHYGVRAELEPMDGEPSEASVLSPREAAFIAQRDSFYMASVLENGWPYVQHRGGPEGFVRKLDERTLGFADFLGNRQYLTVGNTKLDDRVSLFFMDYPNKQRLKLLARAEVFDADERPEVIAQLEDPTYRARIERGFLLHVEAFDWNCPQHITPRFTEAEFAERDG